MRPKQHKKRRDVSTSRRGTKTSRRKKPTSLRQYRAMSPVEQENWDSLAHIISSVRQGIPLRRASKEFGITPGTVLKRAASVLRKRNGRYVATKTDRLLRVLSILKTKGKQEIATRDSRQASLIGGYWAALQHYLQTGDDSALLKFKKIRIVDASGKRHRLLTDLAELNRQASAGVLSFESMYAGGSR
jgi:hypothetical protein